MDIDPVEKKPHQDRGLVGIGRISIRVEGTNPKLVEVIPKPSLRG
jgi:hypothetical protein